MKNLAFTLIELSIVLVIVGLIIGGILVGKDLIDSASIRAQISQIEEIEAGINSFKLKYNCLPGDCTLATSIFGSTDSSGNTVHNGNGDSFIKSIYGLSGVAFTEVDDCVRPDVLGEVSQLFMHLGLSGLGDYAKGSLNIPEALIGREYPYSKFGNKTGVFVSCMGGAMSGPGNPIEMPLFLRQGNIIVIGATGNSGGSGLRIAYAAGMAARWGRFGFDGSDVSLAPQGIPVDAARRIDIKNDDGKPSSGKFGIIAGNPACDNVSKSYNNQPLLTDYPTLTVRCDVTAGKKI